MDNTSFLVIMAVTVCPMSLFAGIVGTLVMLRSMGLRFPWETSSSDSNRKARLTQLYQNGEIFRMKRIPEEELDEIMRAWMQVGFRVLHAHEHATGVWRIWFVANPNG